MALVRTYTPPTLGRDELSPSLLPTINPTLFDQVVESIRITIKQRLDWDVFNPTAWKLLGLTGGPIRKWLTTYIELSSGARISYDPSQEKSWVQDFEKKGFEPDLSKIYLDVFNSLRNSGRVPDEIWEPYNYERDEDTTIVKIFKSVGKYAIIGIVAYAVVLSSPKIIRGFKSK